MLIRKIWFFNSQASELTEKLNGTAKKINACEIKANAQQQKENEKNKMIGINSVECILSTRLPKESFKDLFDALKILIRSNATDDDIKKTLVSFLTQKSY